MLSRPKSELLLPAGSLDCLYTADLYGADAVYAGTPSLSLRTKAHISLEELKEGAKFLHDKGKRLYLTLNLYTHNSDFERLEKTIKQIKEIKPDGVIIADPAVFQVVKKEIPETELHLSTQSNICSYASVDFWKEQGASLCVLARELSFKEIKEIKEKCPETRIETFVHGAMCMAQSGRCLMSNFMAERGSNQGSCAHSCRWQYTLMGKLKDEYKDKYEEIFDFAVEEEFRPGEFYPFYEDDFGSYLFNSKDLCLMPVLNDYLDAGIDSLKVEGRHKTQYYVGTVGRAYRTAMDDYMLSPETWNYEKYMPELYALHNRGYTIAFHYGRLNNLSQNYDHHRSKADYEFLAWVTRLTSEGLVIQAKNQLRPNMIIEMLVPGNKIKNIEFSIPKLITADTKKELESVHGGQQLEILIPWEWLKEYGINAENTPKYTLFRKKITVDEELQKRFEQQSEHLKKEIKAGKCCMKGCNGCLIYQEAKLAGKV